MPGVPRSAAQIAYNRGIRDLAHLKAFLSPDHRLLPPTRLLPDIDAALDRLQRAIKNRELIAIYGDFDADGVTASALFYFGLADLGARTIPYIPHRTDEGHGLSMRGLEAIRSLGAKLILTADCGVSSYDEVEAAREAGLEVIITDHHSVPPRLPRALSIVDPKRGDSAYPSRNLAAVGVAYRVIQGLRDAMGVSQDDNLLDLVALGTVADMAPLVQDNRYLVKRGLEVLNATTRPGLRQMMTVAGLVPGEIDADAVAFGLAPRINAAGRIDHAITSYRLLTAASDEEALPLARELDLHNRERQLQTTTIVEKARIQVLEGRQNSPLIMVGGKDYSAGIVGLAAGKLVEEFQRPAIVLAHGPDVSRASARSIPEFDIIAALQQCDELFVRYGGHSQAAGFVIENNKLKEAEERLSSIAYEQLSGLELVPSIHVDVEMPLQELRGRIIKFISLLAPCGYGNPPPVFLSRKIQVLHCRTLGTEGQHLRLKLKNGNIVWNAIGFNLGGRSSEISQWADLVYRVKTDRREGKQRLELEILDLAKSLP